MADEKMVKETAATEGGKEASAPAPTAKSDASGKAKSPRRRRSATVKKAPAVRTAEERIADRTADRKRKAAARARRRQKENARQSAAESGKAAPMEEAPPSESAMDRTRHGKKRHGVVISDKGDKTITVRIDVVARHRAYKKIVRSSRTLHAHDPSNDARIGDTVEVVECRPLSRLKRWRMTRVLERAR